MWCWPGKYTVVFFFVVVAESSDLLLLLETRLMKAAPSNPNSTVVFCFVFYSNCRLRCWVSLSFSLQVTSFNIVHSSWRRGGQEEEGREGEFGESRSRYNEDRVTEHQPSDADEEQTSCYAVDVPPRRMWTWNEHRTGRHSGSASRQEQGARDGRENPTMKT